MVLGPPHSGAGSSVGPPSQGTETAGQAEPWGGRGLVGTAPGHPRPCPHRACWRCHQRSGSWQPRPGRLQKPRLRSRRPRSCTPWRSSPPRFSGATPPPGLPEPAGATEAGCPWSPQAGRRPSELLPPPEAGCCGHPRGTPLGGAPPSARQQAGGAAPEEQGEEGRRASPRSVLPGPRRRRR